MNIILIGMRGSGKTTVGKLLAKKLDYKFVETDTLIEESVKMTIKDLVNKYGWKKFRNIETQVIKSLKGNHLVISTGGGIVTKEENIHKLKQLGTVIWLNVTINIIVDRISNDNNRPLLTRVKTYREDLENIFKERENIYRNTADYIINVNNKTVSQIVEEIINYDQCQN